MKATREMLRQRLPQALPRKKRVRDPLNPREPTRIVKKKQKARKQPTASKRTPSSRAATSSTASLSKSIRIDRPFPLPSYVKNAIALLDEAGFVAYIVGGSVR